MEMLLWGKGWVQNPVCSLRSERISYWIEIVWFVNKAELGAEIRLVGSSAVDDVASKLTF